MEVKHFFDPDTFTLTYVVYAAETKDAVIIDPVLNYDASASATSLESVQGVVEFIEAESLRPHYILETHAHADHLSGSQALKRKYPNAQVAIGEGITQVQEVFKRAFDLPEHFHTDGRQFDRLFQDGETVQAGSLEFTVLFTPGHTPACASYLFADSVFAGDTIFMPDFGTGRCDFPAGSAEDLYRSITERLYTLPAETRVYVGHDYQPGGRALAYCATMAEQMRDNVQLPANRSREEFVLFRTERDRTLSTPKLLFQSVQINIDAGRLPEASASSKLRYLKIPVNLFNPPTDDSGIPAGEIAEEEV